MSIKSMIEEILRAFRHYRCYHFYSSQFKRYLDNQHFENKKTEGEDAYLQKWKVLSSRVEPYSYRFFSHYLGFTPNIVPEDIGHSYIEEKLNPKDLRKVYEDKCLFPRIIGYEHTPQTVLCRINGGEILDGNYDKAADDISQYVGNCDSLILKPSVDTCSGRGVIKFDRSGGGHFY